MSLRQPNLPLSRPSLLTRLLLACAAIALTTLLLYPLREIAPDISLGVVYLLAVLAVSVIGGAWLGLATAVGSALAYNFFHLAPTGRFTLHDGEDWVALGVFLVTALVASWLADAARARADEAEQRRREADLSAEMARMLLRGGRLDDTLPTAAQRLAQMLGLPSAQIVLEPASGDDRRLAFPLREGSHQIGTVLVPSDTPENVLSRLQVRVVASLEALLAAALERDELLGEVVETAALRQSDVVKTSILRAVSHDLRSPLTAILTSAEALSSSGLQDGERVELAGVVDEEARRLARLIDNLLDLSRLDAHAAEPRPEWCAVDEVLHAAVEDLGLPQDAFNLSIANNLPPVRADAAQLERAFANLLENSSRHSGGHPVSVRARSGHNRILVRIVDRGPGVPSAQRERIFEPFYRTGTETTGHRGSGLGLAIVRGFVEANGGRVWVESLPEQGTTFVVELPLDIDEPIAADDPRPSAGAEG